MVNGGRGETYEDTGLLVPLTWMVPEVCFNFPSSTLTKVAVRISIITRVARDGRTFARPRRSHYTPERSTLQCSRDVGDNSFLLTFELVAYTLEVQ